MYGKRLKQLRKQRGLKQVELSRISGVSVTNLTRYENTEYNIVKSNTVEKLAKALGTTSDYLLGITDFENLEVVELNKTDTLPVPVYGTIPAGRPIEALEVDGGYINIDKSNFRGGKQFIGLKVKGNSMYPFYIDGDTVIVEITADAKSGEDVVAYIGYDHEATLKRFHIKDDHVELEPLNREYPVRSYYKTDIPVRILGVVRELRRNI